MKTTIFFTGCYMVVNLFSQKHCSSFYAFMLNALFCLSDPTDKNMRHVAKCLGLLLRLSQTVCSGV